MTIIVQKYGGTSIGNIDRIEAVATRVEKSFKQGISIAVVLSAMGGETDRLISLAKTIDKNPDASDMDLLLATGEQASIALLSIALKKRGISCGAFTGFQAGVLTDEKHGGAKIINLNPERVRMTLDEKKVAIIAGFQGVSRGGNITTIGRGGSDTTAVALAAALKATSCEIYTDVDGIFTADPNVCTDAKLLEQITYEEMMELADQGAKVLHSRSVEMAAKYKVPLEVRSSFSDAVGTKVVSEEKIEECSVVSGIACNTNEAKVAIRRVPDKIGVTARIFAPIAKANINVDLILQNVSADGFTDLTFTVPKDDLRRAISLAEVAAKEVHAGKVEAAGDIAKVSAVGLGMRSHAGVAHRMFSILANENIAIQMIGTSEIKVSIVIDQRFAKRAVELLHKEFCL